MKKRNSLWGLSFVLVALLIIGDAFNLLTGLPGVFETVASVILLAIAIGNLGNMEFFGILMPLSAIVFINAEALGVYSQRWEIVLAAFFLSVGLKLMFRRKRSWQSRIFNNDNEDTKEGTFKSSKKNNGFIFIKSNFSDHTKYVREDNFKEAQIECNFGSLKVYFNELNFNQAGSTINVESSFGKTRLFLPKNLNVVNHLSTTFGGASNESRFVGDEFPTVTLNGSANFGDISIHFI